MQDVHVGHAHFTPSPSHRGNAIFIIIYARGLMQPDSIGTAHTLSDHRLLILDFACSLGIMVAHALTRKLDHLGSSLEMSRVFMMSVLTSAVATVRLSSAGNSFASSGFPRLSPIRGRHSLLTIWKLSISSRYRESWPCMITSSPFDARLIIPDWSKFRCAMCRFHFFDYS